MSNVEIDEYVFTWRIKNYSSCYQTKNKCIKSPFFALENISDSQWCLSFYPKGDTLLKDDESFISYYLEWKSTKATIKTIKISYNLEIVSENGSVLQCLQQRHREFDTKNSSWGWCRFFDVQKLEKEMSSWTMDMLTLRCRIKSGNQLEHKVPGSSVCTTMEVDRCCVRWLVEMSSLLEGTESLTFVVLNRYDFRIVLKSSNKVLAIAIYFQDEEFESSQQITIALSFCDRNGCKLGSKRATHVYGNKETWEFPDFITTEMLQLCEMKSRYEFYLKCEVCISKKTDSSYIETLEFVSRCSIKSVPNDIPTSAIQSDFRKILLSEDSSDVRIRIENDEFPAHKLVLRLRSPVFAAMFDQDMLESKTGVLNIPDIDEKTLKAFLQFLYTDNVDEMDYDVAKKLIITADKYQVPSLVEKCAIFLKPVVAIENVCEIIAIADMINCEHLKSYAVNFILVNSAEILPTTAWTEWIETNIKLATYILSKLSASIGTNIKLT